MDTNFQDNAGNDINGTNTFHSTDKAEKLPINRIPNEHSVLHISVKSRSVEYLKNMVCYKLQQNFD